MKQKFGIKKTKMNILWLFLLGLAIGGIIGLRQQGETTVVRELPTAGIASEK